FFTCTAFFAVGATEPGNPIDDGGFEADDAIGTSSPWGKNPAYPGDFQIISDKSQAHSGERFLRVQVPGDIRDPRTGVGICFNQKFPRTAGKYRVQFFCRGKAEVLCALSTFGNTKWISSQPSKWFSVTDPSGWELYEGVIDVPESLESLTTHEKELVDTLQFNIYVRPEDQGATDTAVDIDDVVLTEN
ncbi:MAG: hypothetical protein WC765_11155, partial [Phycisphaerae bacterium]